MEESLRKYLVEGETTGGRYVLEIPSEAARGVEGAYLGAGAGSSLDFKDYREYQPGDDLRRIDWGAYARSDRLVIKMFKQEVTPHLDVVMDCSMSMALNGTNKAGGMLGLAAALVAAADNARCTHRAWMAGDDVHPLANASGRPATWDGIRFERAVQPHVALGRRIHGMRPNGIRVLISDLIWDEDPMTVLRALSDKAAVLYVIQVLAREDAKPDRIGNTRLVDVETDDNIEVYVDTPAIEAYAAALARHQENWHNACRHVGARMLTIMAEQLLENWRLDPLEHAGVIGAA